MEQDSCSNEIPVKEAQSSKESMEQDSCSKEIPVKEAQSSKGKEARAKHKCPFPSCKSKVIHLPRHMKSAHGWSKTDARGVLNVFGLRKERTKAGKRKREFKRIMCPFQDCRSVVRRIHNHLTDVHKLTRGCSHYKHVLALAEPHDVIEISSESSSSDESSSSADDCDETWKNQVKQEKQKKCKSQVTTFFDTVYPSSESESSEISDGGNKRSRKNVNSCPKNVSKAASCEDDQHRYDYHAEPPDTCRPSTSSSLPKEPGISSEKDPRREEESKTEGSSSEETSEDTSEAEGSADLFYEDGESLHINVPAEQTIFKKFEQWLKGTDGGRKDERCAMQCSRQVQLVVQSIDPGNPKVSNLFHKNILRDKWLSDFEKSKQPGTVKPYLGALNQFYVFLKCENLPGVDASTETLTCLSDQMKQWSKSFRKMIKDRFWEKRMDDLARLRTPQQVKGFDSSDTARQAIKLLGDFQNSTPDKMPSQSEYTTVRDYLLTVTCINNGSRSGALANMTLGEFKKAQEEDDHYVVNVKKHKTFTTHGPQNVVLTASIYKWMEIFITQFRNKLGEVDTSDTATIFLTWNQRPLNSSQVGKQIGSCWGKVFGKDASLGGATSFRKAAVSAVHKSKEDMREDLATLMVHNKGTADRYYLLQQKTKSAVETSRKLSRIMRNAEDNDSNVIPGHSKGRHQWTSEEETVVKEYFSTQIENQSVSLEEVKLISANHTILSKLTPTKVRDKVRSLYTDASEASLPHEVESPEERLERFGLQCHAQVIGQQENNDNNRDDSEYQPSVIAPSGSSKTTYSKLYTEEETTTFRDVFKDLIESKKPIRRADVSARIGSHPQLKHLLKKYAALQLADKIRTERRIYERLRK